MFVDAAPASATLFTLPRASEPPIENASTMVSFVAFSEMFPPAVIVAWWMYAFVVSASVLCARANASAKAVSLWDVLSFEAEAPATVIAPMKPPLTASTVSAPSTSNDPPEASVLSPGATPT